MEQFSGMAQDVMLIDSLFAKLAGCYSRIGSGMNEMQQYFSDGSVADSSIAVSAKSFLDTAQAIRDIQENHRQDVMSALPEIDDVLEFMANHSLEVSWQP